MFLIDFLMREPVLGICEFFMGFGMGCMVVVGYHLVKLYQM